MSPKGRWLYNLTKIFIPKDKIREIFSWRLKLSERIDRKISTDKPEQIIDLAAGYSLRGFNLCRKDKGMAYIDTDLPNVIHRKDCILRELCKREKIVFPENYFLIPVNVLEKDIFGKIGDRLSPAKKTLITAEGLTSYFSENEFATFIQNIKSLLSNFMHAEFYSHENIFQPKGLLYRILRSVFVSILTRASGRRGFATIEDFATFLEKLDTKFVFDSDQESFLFYSITYK